MDPESRLSTFTASDGDNLAVQDWPLAEDAPLRGQVLLVHGLGEHAGRYAALAQRLNQWGFAVRGYDHYGHGESGGPRGGLNHDLRLLEDLGDVIESTRSRTPRDTPLILLGHSLGGLVASSFVARRLAQVDGLVLSSPALDIGLSPLQTWLLRGLARALPDLRVANGLKLKYLSHDAATVRAYQADPHCHNRISTRLVRFMAEHGPATVAAASRWRVPTLLLYAGDDHLVRPAGSQAFAAAAPSCVESRCFDTLYHELFNESPELAEPVFERLREWLDKHFAPLPG
ncbi:lysophospholipase [Curvibacter sp. RS43]|uniref:Lysophospholipase n=1 Tax=Curvibacter microcysteis TaxID=3026419 RepID=A0ABT5MHG3_9BURK|nr:MULTISPECIES: alpha/beta hydrolase [unclassified Curvibacter]MDD0811003.1 lysophospholipase [Curvibacter sp. RS43]MDD0816041.1 lysophospholipase [Curvibacter sp. HBC28]